ncbi:MAG: hypothetical protein GAK39_01626 [Variovorax sp.]|nr:MAG: hypothetical protein GAK39_01626 [Variovorax sp.]
MRCFKLARIIGVMALVAVLGACSAIKLAYNNLPELSYWWLDGYLDFDGSQTPKVRDELAQLLDWHRRNELPKIAALLQEAETLAPGEVTPAQACAMTDRIRDRLLAVSERAEPAGTELLLSLSEAQLQQLERKYAKNNADYRKDWLDRSPARVQEKRYDQFLDRFEDFYGRLAPEQRELLRQQVAQSVFDPKLQDVERRKRQQEALVLLRGFVANRTHAAHRGARRAACLPAAHRRSAAGALARAAAGAAAGRLPQPGRAAQRHQRGAARAGGEAAAGLPERPAAAGGRRLSRRRPRVRSAAWAAAGARNSRPAPRARAARGYAASGRRACRARAATAAARSCWCGPATARAHRRCAAG